MVLLHGDVRRVACDGLVEAVPPNAPRDPSGKPRVPMTVRVLEDTSKVLTATEVAALADAAVKDGGTDG